AEGDRDGGAQRKAEARLEASRRDGAAERVDGGTGGDTEHAGRCVAVAGGAAVGTDANWMTGSAPSAKCVRKSEGGRRRRSEIAAGPISRAAPGSFRMSRSGRHSPPANPAGRDADCR